MKIVVDLKYDIGDYNNIRKGLRHMKKFEFTEITDEVFTNTKIEELETLSKQVRQTVKIISMLDDGSLHDQLTNAHKTVQDLEWVVQRLQEVHGDWHVVSDEERKDRIVKIARGE